MFYWNMSCPTIYTWKYKKQFDWLQSRLWLLFLYNKKQAQWKDLWLFFENKKLYYDDLPPDEKYKGNLNIIRSPYPYQRLLKTDIPFLDMTYESKSWDYMKNNIPPSNQTLFWCVGIRNYDLRNIEPIKWNKSKHEKELDKKRLEIWNTSK